MLVRFRENKKYSGPTQKILSERRKNNMEFKMNEVKVNDIDILEETEAPAFGIFCGGGCWGIGCAF